MGRLPFDPGKMRARRDTPARAEPEAMSVSAFARLIERAVADAFPRKVTVRGEVSGARHRTHHYFNLKDENAVIGAVMFASAAKRSAVKPTDGRTVLATGKLEYYAPSGRLSLIVESIAEDGQGSLEARFRALCDDLRARGWFDPDAKRLIPPFPRRVAVLTAAGSAALHDVLDTAKQRCPAVELVLIDVPVQGDRAAPTVARTVRALDRRAASPGDTLGIDAILLTRGGGSVEDLWAFNDPDLAAAIHECRIPLVAAIGHESDTTIAELVADHRAATPTQATVRLTPDRAALARQLDSLDARRARGLAHRLELQNRRLAALAQRPVLAEPAAVVGIQRTRAEQAARRLAAATAARAARDRRTLANLEVRLERHRPHEAFARRRDTLAHLARELRAAVHAARDAERKTVASLDALLHAVDPTAVLERGYSITTRDDGTAVRAPADVRPGDALRTRVAGGEIDSRVVEDGAPTTDAEPRRDEPPTPPAARPTGRRPRKPAPSADEPGLFGEG